MANAFRLRWPSHSNNVDVFCLYIFSIVAMSVYTVFKNDKSIFAMCIKKLVKDVWPTSFSSLYSLFPCPTSKQFISSTTLFNISCFGGCEVNELKGKIYLLRIVILRLFLFHLGHTFFCLTRLD